MKRLKHFGCLLAAAGGLLLAAGAADLAHAKKYNLGCQWVGGQFGDVTWGDMYIRNTTSFKIPGSNTIFYTTSAKPGIYGSHPSTPVFFGPPITGLAPGAQYSVLDNPVRGPNCHAWWFH